MRPAKPRIEPLPESEWTDELRAIFAPTRALSGDRVFNIFTTLARHPALLRRWMVFANHVLAKSTLGARERELLILRIGWLCRAEYEWAQHVVIARLAGIADDEIRRVRLGPDAPGWSRADAALLRAVDELHRDACIGDATWAVLRERYGDEELMDLVFTVGQYNLVSMALNSFGVRLDPGLEGFGPDDEPGPGA